MLSLITSLTSNLKFSFTSTIILLPYFITGIFIYAMARKTNQIYLVFYYPVWEIYYLISHIILGPLGIFGKISWGQRNIK